MEEKKEVTIGSISLARALLIAVAVGVLLLVIGADTETSGLVDAGLIISSVALFSGGFLLKEENSNVRLGMLIAGGLILMSFGAAALSLTAIRPW